MFSLCQFWYLHISLYRIIFQVQSIYLYLVSWKPEEQSFLLLSQLLYILCPIRWLPSKSHTSTRYVFSLCQFWYQHIVLYCIIFQRQSIYLHLVSWKREEQSFLLHSQLLYILCPIHWLPSKSHTSARYMCSLFVNSGTYTFHSIVLFFQYNQSIYILRLENQKNSPSFFISNSCIFCAQYTDFLPRVIHQHGMCYLFVNSGTNTLYSIVLFSKDNQSIYILCLENEKNSPSFFIPNSCTFCARYTDFLPRVIHQHGICVLSLSILVPTHFTL